MCEKFDASLSDTELSTVLVMRHHLNGEYFQNAVALALESIDLERARLRKFISDFGNQGPDGREHYLAVHAWGAAGKTKALTCTVISRPKSCFAMPQFPHRFA